MDTFTVAIICYQNFKYIYEVIDSVFLQSYPDIELIISDDGSKRFPLEAIRAYVLKNKTNNITSYSIRHEECNQGTVKHLNHVISECHGVYCSFLAADDALEDGHVLENYVNGFEKAAPGCQIEFAQTAMYDRYLNICYGYYTIPKIRNILVSENGSMELLKILYHAPCLPTTSTCYKREFFQKNGLFNEMNVLIEDYPLHIRIAKEGLPIHYQNFVAVRHRDEGISHGAKRVNSASKRLYFRDCKAIKMDISKHLSEILPMKESRFLKKTIHKEIVYFDFQIYYKSPKITDRIQFALKHPATVLIKGCSLIYTMTKRKGLYSLAVGFAGMMLLPDFTKMLIENFPWLNALQFDGFFYPLFLILMILGGAIEIFKILCKMISSISRFPDNTLYIRS